jgi:hypothetical protein
MQSIHLSMMKREQKQPPVASSGIHFLFQALDELSLKPIDITEAELRAGRGEYRGFVEGLEGYVSISAGRILSDPDSLPDLPIDFEENEPIMALRCLPVWGNSIWTDTEEDDSDFMHNFRSLSDKLEAGDMEFRPFIGCHKDMLECIISQPIVFVETLPVTSTQPLDIDAEYTLYSHYTIDPVWDRDRVLMDARQYLPDHDRDEAFARIDSGIKKLCHLAEERRRKPPYRPCIWSILNILRLSTT